MLDPKMLSEEKSRIEFDLASFVDPGTTLDVTVESARSFRAAWTMRGKGRDAVFPVSPSRGVSVHFGGRNLSYREFITGPDMANLRDVATISFGLRYPDCSWPPGPGPKPVTTRVPPWTC